MKRALFTIPAVCILLSGAGFCSATSSVQNEIGLFYDPDDLTSVSLREDIDPYETLHLVLVNPYFNFGKDNEIFPGVQPATTISGFELRIGLPAGQMAVFIAVHDFQTIGTPPDFAVGFAEPVPVVDNQIYLGMFVILNINPTVVSEYYLLPVVARPSIPGYMAAASLIGPDDLELLALFPNSGSQDAPVFVINGAPVPVEAETWSSVKALYR